jgi:hypothetical protein
VEQSNTRNEHGSGSQIDPTKHTIFIFYEHYAELIHALCINQWAVANGLVFYVGYAFLGIFDPFPVRRSCSMEMLMVWYAIDLRACPIAQIAGHDFPTAGKT